MEWPNLETREGSGLDDIVKGIIFTSGMIICIGAGFLRRGRPLIHSKTFHDDYSWRETVGSA